MVGFLCLLGVLDIPLTLLEFHVHLLILFNLYSFLVPLFLYFFLWYFFFSQSFIPFFVNIVYLAPSDV